MAISHTTHGYFKLMLKIESVISPFIAKIKDKTLLFLVIHLASQCRKLWVILENIILPLSYLTSYEALSVYFPVCQVHPQCHNPHFLR